MKKVIVIILLTYSISGFAVKWEKITQGYDGNSIYIDLDSIEKKESRVYYSNLNKTVIQLLVNLRLIVERNK